MYQINLISNNSDLIIFDGGSHIGKTIKTYKSIFPNLKFTDLSHRRIPMKYY